MRYPGVQAWEGRGQGDPPYHDRYSAPVFRKRVFVGFPARSGAGDFGGFTHTLLLKQASRGSKTSIFLILQIAEEQGLGQCGAPPQGSAGR
jgi:hypothetical protein